MLFQCKIAVAVAHIVQGGTIISLQGSIPIAPTAVTNTDVQEFMVMACLTLKQFSQFF